MTYIRQHFNDERRASRIRLRALCRERGLDYNGFYAGLRRLMVWAGEHAKDGVLRESLVVIRDVAGCCEDGPSLFVQTLLDAGVLVPAPGELFANALYIAGWVEDQPELAALPPPSQQSKAGKASAEAKRKRVKLGEPVAEDGIETGVSIPRPAVTNGHQKIESNVVGNGNERVEIPLATEKQRVEPAHQQQQKTVVVKNTTAGVAVSQNLGLGSVLSDIEVWMRVHQAVTAAVKWKTDLGKFVESWRTQKNYHNGRMPSEGATHDFLALCLEAPAKKKSTEEAYVFGMLKRNLPPADPALRKAIGIWEKTRESVHA